MRILTSIVIVAALVMCFGCARNEPAPADQPESGTEAQVDAEPIAEEDFESGDVGETMTVGEGEAEVDSEDGGSSD